MPHSCHRRAAVHPLAGTPLAARRSAIERGTIALATLLCLPSLATNLPAADADPRTFRVETEVFDDDDAKKPVARSLTLFRDGVAWDFLEAVPKKKGEQAAVEPVEFVLHDPARERIILVDPSRNVRTQIDSLRLERLRASLAAWARKSDDAVLRWAGSPDFSGGMTEESGKVVLVGPRVRYAVDYDEAAEEGAAEEYRKFADAAVLVKALVHPGGLPPFPRIAINRRVAAARGIPSSVRLEVEPRLGRLAGRGTVLRSEHRIVPSWVAADHKRVASAEERIALAEEVDLTTYAGKPIPGADAAAESSRR